MSLETQNKQILRLPQGFGFGGHIRTSVSGPHAGEPPKSTEEFMLRAVIESMRGVGHTNPNPAVGCLLTQNGKIVASGATEKFGGRHAERVAFEALRNQGASTHDLDAYVTLEPCSHHGRQPPCCELFRDAGISNLYVAVADPNPLVGGRGLQYVKKEVKSLSVGLGRTAATAWNLPFLFQHRLGRPLVVAKWAQTLDGALADASGTSKWITGSEARAHGHWLRLKYDITVVGLSTLLADQPSLNVRDCWRPHDRQPDVCVIDVLGEARASDSQLLSALNKICSAADNRKVALATRKSLIPELKKVLPSAVSLLALDEQDLPAAASAAQAIERFWTSKTLETWFGRQPQSIFIEGGAKLISSLLEINALDLLHVFIAPLLLCGEARRFTRQQEPAPALSTASRFDILSTFPLGDDMLLELVPRRLSGMFFSEG